MKPSPNNLRNVSRKSPQPPLVSVIINNYNYAAYLGEAIDSALCQDYSRTEVIVVDDGSTDASRAIIAGYGEQITPIYKSNGGQASALNAGFDASRGDIIIFLDADDILLPSAVTTVATAFNEPGLAKVHWPMWLIDAEGKRSGDTKPSEPPREGDYREQLLSRGPSNIPCSPTSGNAWSRTFLQQVFPVPEEDFSLCADDYVYTLAPAFGRLKTINSPQGCYRIHGKNLYSAKSFRQQLRIELERYDRQCHSLRSALIRNGMPVDLNLWRQHSWFHRLDQAISDIMRMVPNSETFVLVDGGTWGATGEAFDQRKVRPFLQRNGVDWGPPHDCEAAIRTLEAIRADGLRYLAIAWHCFWWFDTYPKFFEHLARVANPVLRNDVIALFCLHPHELTCQIVKDRAQQTLRLPINHP